VTSIIPTARKAVSREQQVETEWLVHLLLNNFRLRCRLRQTISGFDAVLEQPIVAAVEFFGLRGQAAVGFKASQNFSATMMGVAQEPRCLLLREFFWSDPDMKKRSDLRASYTSLRN